MSVPLVLLPGLLCDSRIFEPQFKALSRERPVMVAPVTGASHIETVAARLLPQLPAEFALVGHCFGGNVAMELLRQAPDRVERLCLISTTPLAETPAEAAAREPWIVRAQAGRLEDVLEEVFPPEHLAETPERADHVAVLRNMALDLGPEIFVCQMRAAQRRPDYQATLRRCKLPTLILSGEEDGLTPPRRHSFMADLIPSARLTSLSGAGHAPSLEQPDRVTGILRTWLAGPLVLT